MSELKLPELGENIEQADVAAVLVHEGDLIDKDQAVIEVETEKASLEVPSEVAGRVTELRVKQGDKIKVGQVILVIEPGADSAARGAEPAAERASAPRSRGAGESSAGQDRATPPRRERAHEPESDDPPERDTAGGGRRSERREPAAAKPAATKAPRASASRRAPERREALTEDEPQSSPPTAPRGEDEDQPEQERSSVVAFPAREERPDLGQPVPAAPSVRALARELGVEVAEVPGSGPGGRITREDVKAHARKLIRTRAADRPAARLPGAAGELPDFAQWGEIEREPLSKIRRLTAQAMVNAWTTIPHVTQFDRADVSELDKLRRQYNERYSDRPRLTVTAIAIKIAAAALRRFPRFNASLDAAEDEVIYKRYVHIGVAVDTERGLLVPVIRDADRLGIVDIAERLDDLAQRARARKLAPDEMQGGTFTVTNLGGLGTTHFSPIVHWPEVAILGLGRAETQAIWRDDEFVPGLLLPLSVAYDHRLIDGADAARFLRFIAEALEQPLLLLMEETPR